MEEFQVEDVKAVHRAMILEYCKTIDDNSVEVQLSDGRDSLPVIVLAYLSPQLKTYLSEMASVFEPLVVLPDIKCKDFRLFKKYLFTHPWAEVEKMCNDQDISVINRVLKNLEAGPMSFASDDKGVTKRVPKIIAHSRYGRKRKIVQFEAPPSKMSSDSDSAADETDNRLPCKYCPKVYNHIKARNKHMIAEHLEQCIQDGSAFKCSTCSAMFVSALGLEKHRKTMHKEPLKKTANQDSTLKCPFHHETDDQRSFKRLKDLHIHVRECHPEKDKSCLGCGHDLGTFKALEKHIQIHKQGTAHSQPFHHCEHSPCEKVFLKEFTLVMHKRNEHPTVKETLNCQYCNKDFKNAKFLKTHEDKHRSGFVEEEDHLCPNCGKSFSSKMNLDRHIKSKHNKVKDHECPDCGKRFVDSTRLKEHRWIHTDHKPFACTQCDKSFRFVHSFPSFFKIFETFFLLQT